MNSASRQIRDEVSAAVVRGRWIFYWPPVLRQLARAGRVQEAYELAMECVIVAERTLRWGGNPPPPGWTRFAAVYARKLGRLDLEINVLERYIEIAGDEYDPDIVRRLDLVRETIARKEALKPKKRPDPMF